MRAKANALKAVFATLGGLVLNLLLKIGFNRPRPQIFHWGTYAVSSSFPSGHATAAFCAATLLGGGPGAGKTAVNAIAHIEQELGVSA